MVHPALAAFEPASARPWLIGGRAPLTAARSTIVDWVERVLHRLVMPPALPTSETARAALVRAIAVSSDRAAFISLFEFYAPRIKAQALRFGFDASAAEDIAQEAMLSVWQRAGQFDAESGTASAWIFTIAANARIDRLRRDKRLAHASELDDEALGLTSDGADDSIDGARVGAMLQDLPNEQRRIVMLSFYADVPHAEIAERLGIPLGTVKSRIRLAMAKLRQVLGERP